MSNPILQRFAPDGCPDGWTKTAIGLALREVSDPIEMRDEEEYDLVSIRRRHGGMFHRERLPGREILTKTLQRVIPGTFVLARMQIVHGACALAGEEFAGSAISKSYSSFAGTECCDARFFSLLAQQPFMADYFRDSSQGVVIEKMTFQQSRWLEYPVYLPPLEEQRRIAEILDTTDSTIWSSEQLISKVAAVGSGVRNTLLQGLEGSLVTLHDIATLRGGHGFPEEEQGHLTGSIPFYKVSDMNEPGNEHHLYAANNYVEHATAQRLGWRTFPAGAVVFAKVGAALLSNRRRILSTESLIDNNMMAAIPRNEVTTEWLHRWMQTVDLGELVQVGALPSVNQSLVGGLSLTLPSLAEQHRQVAVLADHSRRVDVERHLLKVLIGMRAGLAADLLSGRVRTMSA